MSRDRSRAEGTDYSWPRWLVWAFIVVSLATSVHWSLHNVSRLERGDSLLIADGVKYYSYLPSVLLQGNLDLFDEIEALSPRASRGLERGKGPLVRTSTTGLVTNVFPVGTPLMWSPFFLSAHALIRGQGLDPAYQLAILFGSLVYGLASLALMVSILRRFFAPSQAFFGALLAWAGGFGYFYTVYRGDMSHACSIFMAALVIRLWLSFQDSFSLSRAALFGVAAGLMILVRPQNALLLIVPVSHSAWNLVKANGWTDWGAWTRLAGRWALAGLAAAVLFSLQLLVWSTIFGSPTPPMASNFFQFGNPGLVEILFSRNGIISVTPMLGLAIAGLALLLKRDAGFFIPCLATVLLFILLYSISGDWWCGSDSFGIRRFDNATPLLALGMAATIGWMTGFFRRHAGIAAALILAPVLFWQLLSMQTVSEHLGRREYLSLTSLAEANLSQIRDTVGWPLSLPGSLPFALAHGVAPKVYDAVTGRPAERNLGNLLAVPELLVDGWQASEAGDDQWIINGSRARILFMVRMPGRLVGELRCIVRRTPPKGAFVLAIAVNGVDGGRKRLLAGRNDLVFRLPENSLKAGVNELVFRLLLETEGGKLVEAGCSENVRFRHVSLPRIEGAEEVDESDESVY